MTKDDEIAYCQAERVKAVDQLALIQKGVKFLRGVPGAGTDDVTDKHKATLEGQYQYWTMRLQLLGIHDA